jgi:hypothetical protein
MSGRIGTAAYINGLLDKIRALEAARDEWKRRAEKAEHDLDLLDANKEADR